MNAAYGAGPLQRNGQRVGVDFQFIFNETGRSMPGFIENELEAASFIFIPAVSAAQIALGYILLIWYLILDITHSSNSLHNVLVLEVHWEMKWGLPRVVC